MKSMRIKSGDHIDGLAAALLLLYLQILAAIALLTLRLLDCFALRRFLSSFAGLPLAVRARYLLFAATRHLLGPGLFALLAIGASLLLNLRIALLS